MSGSTITVIISTKPEDLCRSLQQLYLVQLFLCLEALEEGHVFNDDTLPRAIGIQLAQVASELKTQYSNITLFCCEQLTQFIRSNPANRISNILYPAENQPGVYNCF